MIVRRNGTEARPGTALTPGLLAREGQATPAMRQQAYEAGNALDDLCWDDTGRPPTTAHVHAQAEVVPEPRALAEQQGRETSAPHPTPDTRRRLSFTMPTSRGSGDGRDKAAFTLRLDAPRHLRLRLACALHRRSAQQTVTAALDAFLAAMPEVEALAQTLPDAQTKG